MADLMKISVPGKIEYVGVVRLAISSAANAAGFDLDDIEDIKIAVTEACTQLFDLGDGKVNYEIRCELGDGKLVISVDEDHDTASPEKKEIAERKNCDEDMRALSDWPCYHRNMAGIGGLAAPLMQDVFDPTTSLLMMRALMDEVDIFSRRNESMLIRMMKYL